MTYASCFFVKYCFFLIFFIRLQVRVCKCLEMVRPKGFEPLTLPSGGQRSLQRSYGRLGLFLPLKASLSEGML